MNKGPSGRREVVRTNYFTVRMLNEKTIAKNKRMIMVCVDLEKAYDNVNKEFDVECAGRVWN